MTKRMLAAIALAALGCASEQPPRVKWEEVTIRNHDQVDLLFLVDNSPSMAPKQAELRARFPRLVEQLMTNPTADYHIGVVTSDLGAGAIFLLGGQCHPGGDGARLQSVGAAAAANCRGPVGAGFVQWNQQTGAHNLPAGQTLAETFGCMASVGDMGCGFEMPLESVYRALHDPPPENRGFLRAEAQLVVVFVTDEDDCSADPATELFDPAKADYGPLTSYRCSRYGVVAGAPAELLPAAPSGGPVTAAAPAPNPNGAGPGKLYDVGRYIDFFTKPASAGGVKADPGDVSLFAIAAPPFPVESVLAVPGGSPCAGADGVDCTVTLAHSCVAASDPAFFGDPAVRLGAVVEAAGAGGALRSICDTDYGPAMQSMGQKVLEHQRAPRCFADPLATPASPSCEVELDAADGTVAALPSCDAAAGACFVVTSDGCAPDRQRVAVRLAAGAPLDRVIAGPRVRARCLTAPGR